MNLNGWYVLGDEDGIVTDADLGEPWRTEIYESLDYARRERDILNSRPGPVVKVYELREVDDREGAGPAAGPG